MTGCIPDWRLVLDGEDISARFRPRLQSLTLTEKRDQAADELQLVLTDHDGQLAIPRSGAELTLSLGWRRGFGPAGAPEGLIDKGRFKVDQPEHSGAPDLLTLKARSADFASSIRVRRDGGWKGKTLKDVLGELAARQGLEAKIDPALAGIQLPVLEQGRESDAALLARLGREYDAVATVKAGRLVFAPKGKGSTAGGLVLPTVALVRSLGDSHRWSRAERDSYGGVEAAWHDKDSAEQKTVSVGGGAGSKKRLRKVYASEASAKRAAEAEDAKVARSKATFDFSLALGRPDLYPEQRVTVSGFKPEIDQTTWLIAQVTHSFGDQGLTTQLQCETAP